MLRTTNLGELLRWSRAQQWDVSIRFGDTHADEDTIILDNRRGSTLSLIGHVDAWKDQIDFNRYDVREDAGNAMVKLYDPEGCKFWGIV